MRRLEIIHLRMSGTDRESLASEIRASIMAQPGLVELRIYQSVPASTDLSIHLHIEAGSDGVGSGELGVRVTEALREYGMVEHSTWTEMEP